MAHELQFHYDPKSGGDPCSLDGIVEDYIEFRNAPVKGTSIVFGAMDVSDMLAMTRRPEQFIEKLAAYVADFGSTDDVYDISKFGFWDCSACGAEELDIWSFRSDCDEDSDEE